MLNLRVVALPNIPKKADAQQRADLFGRKSRPRTSTFVDKVLQTRLLTKHGYERSSIGTKLRRQIPLRQSNNISSQSPQPVRPSLPHPPHLPSRDPCLHCQFRLVYFGDPVVPLYVRPWSHIFDSNTLPSANYKSNYSTTLMHNQQNSNKLMTREYVFIILKPPSMDLNVLNLDLNHTRHDRV